MNVLVNAYACNPYWGSEQGIGWHWSIELAKYCKVIVITEGEFWENIEKALAELPQKDNLTFIYNNVSDRVRKMCWNQGDWRFYFYYRKWQMKTLEIAREICEKERIDIIHQLNMQGFREPGLLWKIKGPKYVWGPVGGMGLIPMAYLKGEPLKKKIYFRVKNIINSLQSRYQPNVRHTVERADVLLASTPDEQRIFKEIYHRDSYFLNDTGCELNMLAHDWSRTDNAPLDILWVGKFDFRKQLALAIRVIGELRDLNVRLNIVGGGPNENDYKRLAEELGVTDKCIFHEILPNEKVLKMMQLMDFLFFTSIKEGTPTVIPEAISSGLPIVCFDTCGFGPIVDESIGKKIKITNPEQSVKDFADVIRHICHHRELLPQMSEKCGLKQQGLSWSHKAEFVVEIYEKLLTEHNASC